MSARPPSSAEESDSALGHIEFAPPFRVNVDMDLRNLVHYPLPWGSIGGMAARGVLTGHPSAQHLALGYEWPVPVLGFDEPVTKERLEALHLSRYCTDRLVASGSLPYRAIERGGHVMRAPDFTAVDTVGKTMNIDCVQYAIAKRRHVVASFEKIKRTVLDVPRERFARLRGSNVYMWFEDKSSLPHRTTDHRAIDEIIEALAAIEPDFTHFRQPYANPPAVAPDFGIVRTSYGAAMYAAPMRFAFPATTFFLRTGFEMGVGYTTDHDAESEFATIKKLIDDHDKPEIDDLIISVAAPNRSGLAFNSEDLCVSFAIDIADTGVAPVHLSCIHVHSWYTGRIIELWPRDRHEVQAAIFAGPQIPALSFA